MSDSKMTKQFELVTFSFIFRLAGTLFFSLNDCINFRSWGSKSDIPNSSAWFLSPN